MIKTLPPLVENAREQGWAPRVHPNGFLQLNLTESGVTRLHIWHPDLPRQDVRTIVHDHIFHMMSAVKKGRLDQVRHLYALEHGGNPTDEIYMARDLGGSESTLEPTGVLVRRWRTEADMILPSNCYTQPAFTFHESNPDSEVVVTIMTKTQVHKGFQPRVLVPIGETPDNSFRRADADEDFLWKIIEESV